MCFLIEVNWRNGRVLREFTLLLDPPSLTDERSAPVEMAGTAPPPEFTVGAAPSEGAPSVAQLETPADLNALVPLPETQPEVALEPPVPLAETPLLATEESLAELTAEPVREVVSDSGENGRSGSTAPGQYQIGPVKGGARLWNLADKAKPSGVTVEQMMLAYLRDNPQAFFGNNVSMLKEGAVLRIEDSDRITDVDASAAIAEIAKQHSGWLDSVRKRQAQTSPVAAASIRFWTLSRKITESHPPMSPLSSRRLFRKPSNRGPD